MQVALPSQSEVEHALPLFLGLQGRPIETNRVYAPLAETLRLTREQLTVSITTPNGRENRWENLVRFARRRLVDDRLMADLDNSERGYWVLTDAGRERGRLREKFRAGTLTSEDLGF